MAIMRDLRTYAAPVRPDPRTHVENDPARGVDASGMDICREGSHTLARVDRMSFRSQNRPLESQPVPNSPSSDYDDSFWTTFPQLY